MAWAAIRVVISEEEQYRLTVTPGTSSLARMEITRPMLWPCSPPGSPHPQIRSSISVCSSWGTFSRTLVTTCAPRSSGRTSTSDPLRARPIADRPSATITASVTFRLSAVSPRPAAAEGKQQERHEGHHHGEGHRTSPEVEPAADDEDEQQRRQPHSAGQLPATHVALAPAFHEQLPRERLLGVKRGKDAVHPSVLQAA